MHIAVFLLLLNQQPQPAKPATDLRTTAERTGYKSTSTYDDVMALSKNLAAKYPSLIKVDSIGASVEGRKLPMLVVSNDPSITPQRARESGKTVVLTFGNIHAGEVCGKEALMMLTRELCAQQPKLFENMILLVVPILNADGNEKMAADNRPGQNGPDIMGIRENSKGLDLNRDFTKLESPEVAGLVQTIHTWDPAVVVDTHATNGCLHQYLITYDGPRHAACHPELVDFVNKKMLPEITTKLVNVNVKSTFYGSLGQKNKAWQSYHPTPRYGIQYIGLRNRISILSEAFVYAPFKQRVEGTYWFVKEILEYTNNNRQAIAQLLTRLDQQTTQLANANEREQEKKTLAVRTELGVEPGGITIASYDRTQGKLDESLSPREYTVEWWNKSSATHASTVPFAYIIPRKFEKIIHKLLEHGISVDELREDLYLQVETAMINRVEKASRPYQNHQSITLTCTNQQKQNRLAAGSFVVFGAQRLARVAAILLDPSSEDGLVHWNYFDDAIKEGSEFPVVKLMTKASLLTTPWESQTVAVQQPITLENAFGPNAQLNLNGSPIAGLSWLDSDHYVQNKQGVYQKIEAKTGSATPLYDREKFEKSIAKLPNLNADRARSLSGSRASAFSKDFKHMIFEHENDLYLAHTDGSDGARLTAKDGKEELPELSADGKKVAFVRSNNLHVVDVEKQAEHALTTDGDGIIINGKADWVYFEEVYNRKWKGFWWSPDSKNIAYIRYDDSPVQKFAVTQPLTPRQELEVTAYPKAGDPNPLVTLAVVNTNTRNTTFLDLSTLAPKDHIILRVQWSPTGEHLYFYLTDRIQTKLDVVRLTLATDKIERLFTETTKAWVNDPEELVFLKDGSFLFASERDGWRHLYHYNTDGTLKRRVTQGEWEARDVAAINEAAGWVYFVGMKDSGIAANLYRAHLAEDKIERLTGEKGWHTVDVSPDGSKFIDSWSSHQQPTRVVLRDGNTGKEIRTLDTNPVRALNRVSMVPVEYVRIPMPDGYQLYGTVVKPKEIDPKKKYPVWIMTYAGPHSPTVADRWSGGASTMDQMLANMGIIAVHVDPRSASGVGAVSAWTAYKQLGVQETKDLESTVDWILKTHPYADETKVGLTGHSYGGYITAYAMTHSKKFAAGISGAPVTDWANYDSIYTERFMDTPQNNPEGYKKSSCVAAAGNLHGKLLILHGFVDDNVHVQNTLQFAHALQSANKDFEMMIYPTSRHGIFSPHVERLKMNFIRRVLLNEQTPISASQASPIQRRRAG